MLGIPHHIGDVLPGSLQGKYFRVPPISLLNLVSHTVYGKPPPNNGTVKERENFQHALVSGKYVTKSLPFLQGRARPPFPKLLCLEPQIEDLKELHKCLVLVTAEDNRNLIQLDIQVEPWAIADPQWRLGAVLRELCLPTNRSNDILG